MTENTRPEWDFELTEEQVRKLDQPIIKITHHWEFTSADTARSWIVFYTKTEEFEPPDEWAKLFNFTHGSHGLIEPNYRGRDAIERVREIDGWERRNKKDREQYERLKQKFGDK